MRVKYETPDSVKHVIDHVNIESETDYIKDGVLYKHSPAKSVIVNSESELSDLAGYTVGTIAYIAGFSKMWQLNASGDWISMV